jgi:hypothetical protein
MHPPLYSYKNLQTINASVNSFIDIYSINYLIMKIYQQTLQLRQHKRGFHIITAEVVNALPQISDIKIGICQVFIQHTSASLSINENADPTVRQDFEMYFNNAGLLGIYPYPQRQVGTGYLAGYLFMRAP